jgi:hypothetical protein
MHPTARSPVPPEPHGLSPCAAAPAPPALFGPYPLQRVFLQLHWICFAASTFDDEVRSLKIAPSILRQERLHPIHAAASPAAASSRDSDSRRRRRRRSQEPPPPPPFRPLVPPPVQAVSPRGRLSPIAAGGGVEVPAAAPVAARPGSGSFARSLRRLGVETAATATERDDGSGVAGTALPRLSSSGNGNGSWRTGTLPVRKCARGT